MDAGHAEWSAEDVLRITSDGYDFLNAVGQREDYRAKFIELFLAGKPYAEAALLIVNLVRAASS